MKKKIIFLILLCIAVGWNFKKEIALTLIPLSLNFSNPIAENREIIWPANKERVISEKPNIILILADDLGFNDVSFYNGGAADGSLKTPNIETSCHSYR